MPSKRFHLFVMAVLVPAALTAEPATGSLKPPNFILMLADDLGYGDLGVTGSKQIPTPHIDSLAAIRVPMVSGWPASLPFGRTIDAMVSSLDIFPTFVSATGGKIEKSDKLTGVDLLPFLTEKPEQPPHESLMWTYAVGSAIRSGDWKLIRLPDRLPVLYHLSADPGEQSDLALEHLDRTRSMLKELGHWEVASPNPVFREPSDWRTRHLRFYDSDYQMLQPE